MVTVPMKNVDKRPSAVANGFRNSIGTGALALGGLVSSVIVVRSLSITEYGRLSFYLWLASSVGSLGLLAFPPALTKVVSQLYGSGEYSEAESLIPWVGQILFILNVALGAAMIVFSLFSPAIDRPFLLTVGASLLPGAMARVINSRVLARENYQIGMITSITTAILILIAVVLAHFAHARAVGYEVVLLSGGVIQWVVLYFYTRRASFIRWGRHYIQPQVRRTYLSYLMPSTLLILFDLVVWQRSEVYFLNLYAPLSDVGYYSISYTLFSTFNLLGAALLNGLFPSVSHDYGAGNLQQLAEKSRVGVALAIFYGLPISLGGIVVAPEVLELFYGHQVFAAGAVARVLIAGVVPGTLTVAMTLSLSAGGQVWKSVRIGAIFSLVNVALDLLLIPHGFAIGAAVANTLTQLGYAVAIVVSTMRTFTFSLPWRLIGSCGGLSVLLPFGLPLLASFLGMHGIPELLVVSGAYAVYWLWCWKLGILKRLRV